MTGPGGRAGRCLVALAALCSAAPVLASDCVFVAADEAGSAVRFSRTQAGILTMQAWNDASPDQRFCVYQPGWPVTVPDAATERFLPDDFPDRAAVQERMAERNVFTCEHSSRTGALSFVASQPLGPIDIAVIDGHAYYQDCSYGQ